ncbi:serine protein kinase PrkA [Desulfosarcina ovata]|uniref:ATPase AAA n=2 Tax=Desulfosarcina ovata TaxID=83564 RepID=A0A5K8ADW0_9BACT|nr:serine protein kinase PrkA [Desulfosarcina ovata]BBO84293.1 ATPase AAA [Desulfosarcina ovata subsp. sediminis]BBO90805.1 ATPase AAA [Desulfosarcina ovata subsp. ovata]
MDNIKKAMQQIDIGEHGSNHRKPIPFEAFLQEVLDNPTGTIRNVFQVFHDLFKEYVGEGHDEYPNDPESIQYVSYDCSQLLVEDADHPFFADRLFANRLVNHVEALRSGAQQNKIYIFDGPHGCGKSTFLNNLLKRFEEYANTGAGTRYETVWRLDRRQLMRGEGHNETASILESLFRMQQNPDQRQFDTIRSMAVHDTDGDYVEVPCPCHDNPLLLIPKSQRRQFLDELFENNEFKYTLFTDKAFEWIFHEVPCTICGSLYDALYARLKSTAKVFEMIHAVPYTFNRRLGKGISVFSPGDRPVKEIILSNEYLQRMINRLFSDSNQVRYIYSQYAKTNNGIYALMDIKSHNIERLIELHNIISEGLHKVEDIEENVSSLFLALMNPEDKKNIKDFQSFSDRIVYINIPYVLDLNTEVEIYRNIFGTRIDDSFLPRVLHNFARVIISSRLSLRSEAMLDWIREPAKYNRNCDKNLQLLKMEIYTGHIPEWLSEEDRKALTAKRRRRIISESENEGRQGISGRDSIKIFNSFFTTYAKSGELIDMSMLCKFFHAQKELKASIPDGFLDSLLQLYDYSILQEVKESLYYYNEEQIHREILHYMFAVNFEPGAVETCNYTGETVHVTDDLFDGFERRLLGEKTEKAKLLGFRKETQKEYTSRTLTQEIMVAGTPPTETRLFQSLKDRYEYNLKEKVLDPFLENENFRRAIKDYAEEDFKTYDQKIRDDVTFVIDNLMKRYRYTEHGAKAICMYVIDNDLARKFTKP